MRGETLGPTFQPVDERQDPAHDCSVLLQGLGGGERARTGRQRIFNDHAPGPRRHAPFDTLACPVLLRFLTNGEGIQGVPLQPAAMGDRVRYRVRAHREATDVRGIRCGTTYELIADQAHQNLALGGHGRSAGVHVVG